MQLNGATTASGDLAVTPAGSVTVTANTTVAGQLKLLGNAVFVQPNTTNVQPTLQGDTVLIAPSGQVFADIRSTIKGTTSVEIDSGVGGAGGLTAGTVTGGTVKISSNSNSSTFSPLITLGGAISGSTVTVNATEPTGAGNGTINLSNTGSIAATTSLDITTNGPVSLGGPITGVGSAVTINAGANFSGLSTIDTSAASGSVTVNSGTVFAGSLSTGGITSGAVTLAANDRGQTALGILSNGAIASNGAVKLSTIGGGSNIALLSNVVGTSQVALTAAGGVILGNNVTVTSNAVQILGDKTINASATSDLIGGTVLVKSGLAAAGSALSLGRVDGSSATIIANGGAVSLTGNISETGAVAVSGGGSLNVVSAVKITGDTVSLSATGAVNAASSSQIDGGTSVSVTSGAGGGTGDLSFGRSTTPLLNLTAGNGSISIAGLAKADVINLNAAFDIAIASTGQVLSSGPLTVSAPRDIQIGSDIGGSTLSLTAGRNISFFINGQASGMNGATLRAGHDINMGSNGRANAFQGALSLAAGTNSAMGPGSLFAAFLNARSVAATATGDVLLNVTNATAGDIVVNPAGAVTVSSVTTATGKLDVSGARLTTSGAISANQVKVSVTGDVALNANVAGTQGVDIRAGQGVGTSGGITTTPVTGVRSVQISGQTVVLMAADNGASGKGITLNDTVTAIGGAVIEATGGGSSISLNANIDGGSALTVTSAKDINLGSGGPGERKFHDEPNRPRKREGRRGVADQQPRCRHRSRRGGRKSAIGKRRRYPGGGERRHESGRDGEG